MEQFSKFSEAVHEVAGVLSLLDELPPYCSLNCKYITKNKKCITYFESIAPRVRSCTCAYALQLL